MARRRGASTHTERHEQRGEEKERRLGASDKQQLDDGSCGRIGNDERDR
jgi:hypothetical protein